MMPVWSVQDLRDRERDLRALADRRRLTLPDGDASHGAVQVELVPTVASDPCGEPCLERAS